jgi:hypothetical protein
MARASRFAGMRARIAHGCRPVVDPCAPPVDTRTAPLAPAVADREAGVTLVALGLLACVLFGFALVSRRIEGSIVTAPMLFVSAAWSQAGSVS